jgi:hypothetical protein
VKDFEREKSVHTNFMVIVDQTLNKKSKYSLCFVAAVSTRGVVEVDGSILYSARSSPVHHKLGFKYRGHELFVTPFYDTNAKAVATCISPCNSCQRG